MSDLRQIRQFHTDNAEALSIELSAHEDAVDRSLDSAAKIAAPRLSPTNTKTSAYTAKVGDLVMCSGAFRVTLPVATAVNAGLRVGLVTNATMTIGCASGLVQGVVTDTLLASGRYEYESSGVGWWRMAAAPANEIISSDAGIIGEAAALANGHVISLGRSSAITTTQMPANTGDGVIYLANATTVPTASSVSGSLLYVEAGATKVRGTGGTVTTIGPA